MALRFGALISREVRPLHPEVNSPLLLIPFFLNLGKLNLIHCQPHQHN